MIIKRIGPLSVAKLAGVLYGVIGVVIGGIFSLAAMAGAMASEDSGGALFGALFGIGAVVVFPLLYGGMAFVMMLITAWLYNVLAGVVGGVEIDVQ